MKTILDGINDHHFPYPCRYCGAMAVKMDLKGVGPAGLRFLQDYYPDGFYIQSCKCIDEAVDRMDEEKYIKQERAAVAREDWEAGASGKPKRKRYGGSYEKD